MISQELLFQVETFSLNFIEITDIAILAIVILGSLLVVRKRYSITSGRRDTQELLILPSLDAVDFESRIARIIRLLLLHHKKNPFAFTAKEIKIQGIQSSLLERLTALENLEYQGKLLDRKDRIIILKDIERVINIQK